MSKTYKDSRDSRRQTVIEVIKAPDGTFDLFTNHELERKGIQEEWMPDLLCARFGYCYDEYDALIQELNRNGRIKLPLTYPVNSTDPLP
jgi:FMN phosphatase YigB (HAD superfamily)